MEIVTFNKIKTAIETLLNGGVVIIPTDTVYGIAAHPDFPSAVERICLIKGRKTEKPIAMLASDMEAVLTFCDALPPSAEKLMNAFWPGALTLVLPCANNKFEGFRVPNHPEVRAMLKACGGILRVTSANLSGRMPALSAAQALKDVGLEANLTIDGGVSPGGTASTVVRVDKANNITILREGAISPQQIYTAIEKS